MNIFLVLGKGPTDDIDDSFGTAETKFTFNFPKANTKFSLGLHYNGDGSYLYVNETNFKFSNLRHMITLIFMNI